MEKRGIKIAAQNRKAYHDYFVEDRYEAGIELAGTEVKSIRAGHAEPEGFLLHGQGRGAVTSTACTSPPMRQGNIFNKDPDRPRRLLMHKREIRKLHALREAGRLRPGAPEPCTSRTPG